MSLPPPWLTEEELRDLTGYVRPTRQARWFTENGIRCFVNALGRVRVSRDALAMVNSGAKSQRLAEPDFSKMPKRHG